MIYRGTVKGNTVTLEPGATLPEGTVVRVEIETLTNPEVSASQIDVFEMGDLAVETGIPDLAVNLDHYLYGHPKVNNAE